MRRRRPPCDDWLLVESGEAVGYGSPAACPGGPGLEAALQRLYAALGFKPVALTRTWAQNVSLPS